jgi:hypothetical protein
MTPKLARVVFRCAVLYGQDQATPARLASGWTNVPRIESWGTLACLLTRSTGRGLYLPKSACSESTVIRIGTGYIGTGYKINIASQGPTY